MTGANAIGMNMFQNYGYDPYFMQAFNSYNPMFMGAMQAQNQQDTTLTQTQAANTQNPSSENTTFKGSDVNKEKKEKNHTASIILGGAAIAATAYACIKGHQIGNGDKWTTKTIDGLKQYWNKGIDAVSKWKVKTTPQTQLSTEPRLLTAAPVMRKDLAFYSEDGKNITKCLKNGKEFDFTQMPEGFLKGIRRDLGIAA